MRVPILVAALVLAGCTGAGDEGTPSPSVSTPTPTPAATSPASVSPTPAPAPASPSPAGNGTAPPQGEPFSGFWMHDHNGPAGKVTFEVPAGAPPADVVISFIPLGGAMPTCDAGGASVTIHDPVGIVLRAEGEEAASCGDGARASGVPMRAGTWTIWSNGSAPIASSVAIGGGQNGSSAPRAFRYETDHDYANVEEAVAFDVPAGIAPVDVRMAFEPSLAAACVPLGEVTMTLTGPEGGVWATHELTPGVGLDGCGSPRVETGVQLPPGAWSISFTGSGQLKGVLTIAPANA